MPAALTAIYRRARRAAAELSPAGRVLNEWRALVGTRYHAENRFYGQGLIRPYVRATSVGGVPTQLLMATVEGEIWYGEANPYAAELALFARHGLVRPGDVVFDLGANQGVTSIALSRLVGPRGRVFAFDPFALNCDLIRLNCKLNGVANVEVIPVGVGERAETLSVPAWHQQCLPGGESFPDAVAVRVEPLDAFADLRPDFVKMDIEGSEVAAARGGRRLFGRLPRAYVELHRDQVAKFGHDCAELLESLAVGSYEFARLWDAPESLRAVTAAGLAGGGSGHLVLR